MTKLGRLMPTRAITESALSVKLPRFLPAITPNGIAMHTAISMATMASSIVAG